MSQLHYASVLGGNAELGRHRLVTDLQFAKIKRPKIGSPTTRIFWVVFKLFSRRKRLSLQSEKIAPEDTTMAYPSLVSSLHEIDAQDSNLKDLHHFGPSILPHKFARGDLHGFRLDADRLVNRRQLNQQAPLTPGVYGYFDRNGRLNYVGKSKSLRKRLTSYFAKTPPDGKMTRIVQHSKFIRWEPISHELLALIREQELISRWRPSFNVQGQPQRRQPAFLCLSDRDAPHVLVTTKINEKTRHGFGPIPGTRRLRETAEQLNHVFRLRDCNDQVSIRFTDQLELFPIVYQAGCIRYEIGSCSGPCTGTFRQSDYSGQVTRLLDFLNGNDPQTLDGLEKEMMAAAGRHAFEKATMLRDQLQNIRWLSRRLEDLRRNQTELNCIYPVSGFRKRRIWICLSSGMISAVLPQPKGRRQADRTLNEIRTADSSSQNQLAHDTTTVLMQVIVSSWFRKNPSEKKQLVSFDEATNVCEKKIAA